MDSYPLNVKVREDRRVTDLPSILEERIRDAEYCVDYFATTKEELDAMDILDFALSLAELMYWQQFETIIMGDE